MELAQAHRNQPCSCHCVEQLLVRTPIPSLPKAMTPIKQKLTGNRTNQGMTSCTNSETKHHVPSPSPKTQPPRCPTARSHLAQDGTFKKEATHRAVAVQSKQDKGFLPGKRRKGEEPNLDDASVEGNGTDRCRRCRGQRREPAKDFSRSRFATPGSPPSPTPST